MNFRSLRDMELAINRGLPKIASRFDLVAGVPRSGMIPAARIAASLCLPLTDVGSLISGRLFDSGFRGEAIDRERIRRIIVVDDSCCSGRELARTRKALDESGVSAKFHVEYCTVFVAPEAVVLVDHYFDVCPLPRVFSWNVLNHSLLASACVDLDGVLCRDPEDSENDDGARYTHFISSVDPLVVPSWEIGAIVTARLEKYRDITEQWLKDNGIRFRNLFMLNLCSAEERRKLGLHARFKGEVFREQKWAEFFVESSASQAQEIANVARKQVISLEQQQLCEPDLSALSSGMIQKALRKAFVGAARWKILVHLRLMAWNRW